MDLTFETKMKKILPRICFTQVTCYDVDSEEKDFFGNFLRGVRRATTFRITNELLVTSSRLFDNICCCTEENQFEDYTVKTDDNNEIISWNLVPKGLFLPAGNSGTGLCAIEPKSQYVLEELKVPTEFPPVEFFIVVSFRSLLDIKMRKFQLGEKLQMHVNSTCELIFDQECNFVGIITGGVKIITINNIIDDADDFFSRLKSKRIHNLLGLYKKRDLPEIQAEFGENERLEIPFSSFHDFSRFSKFLVVSTDYPVFIIGPKKVLALTEDDLKFITFEGKEYQVESRCKYLFNLKDSLPVNMVESDQIGYVKRSWARFEIFCRDGKYLFRLFEKNSMEPAILFDNSGFFAGIRINFQTFTNLETFELCKIVLDKQDNLFSFPRYL